MATRDGTRVKLVKVGEALDGEAIERLVMGIKRAFRHLVAGLDIVPYEPPPFEEIEASLLTSVLDQEVGGHILGVTEADLIDANATGFHQFMFGGKDNRNEVAIVSTRRLRRRSGDLAVERVVKVALHELGHNFGLGHHYRFEPAGASGYCPMSKGDYNGYGERGYLRAVIDARGFSFCRSCRELMRRHALRFGWS